MITQETMSKGCLRILSNTTKLINIMWPASQSHFHLSFIFIEMNFYSLSFFYDICKEVHEHRQ